MAWAKRPVTIDGIEFSALIESTESWEADVPTYPVEEGFEVSDSIILKPLTLNMTLFVSNTAVTWSQHNSPSRVQDVLKRLEDLYFRKQPVTVTTSDKTYQNMAVVSIELTKTLETGSSREIPISFQEIRVTESKTTTIPASYGKSGTTGANAGTANTTKSDTPAAASSETASSSAGSVLSSVSSVLSGGSGDGGSRGTILNSLAEAAGLY